MAGNSPSTREMVQLINNVLGQHVLSEQQLNQIMKGAKKAHERGGMASVLEYLMKVTQADVEKGEVEQFAKSVQKDPQKGMDILQGKRKAPRNRKK